MNHILRCQDIVKTDFVRGEGCYLYDSQGRRYVDFESGIWSTALGYGHPRINQVMQAQIERIMHLGTRYPSDLAEAAAVAVLEVTGLDITGLGPGKCTFLSSGSEAVEFAAETARRVTGRPLLLAFENAYLAAYGSAGRKRDGDWLLLDWQRCDGQELGDCLAQIPFDQVGGFIFEPGGSGTSFVQFPPAPLACEIARRVQAAGGLLVANEVTTGMGRTGNWFGFQHYDIQPDVVALGKGLGNGYPVSAVAMRADIATRLEESGFHYAQSHQNDPLGCAVASEVIDTLRDEGWVESGAETGRFFLDDLQRLAERNVLIKEARGRGMLLGLELYPHEHLTVQAVYDALVEDGFLIGFYPAGNVLRFDPALIVKRDDISDLLVTLERILAR